LKFSGLSPTAPKLVFTEPSAHSSQQTWLWEHQFAQRTTARNIILTTTRLNETNIRATDG